MHETTDRGFDARTVDRLESIVLIKFGNRDSDHRIFVGSPEFHQATETAA